MLALILSIALFQQPQQVQRPQIVKISEPSNQKLKDAVQKMKDLQAQVESGQRETQTLLLQVIIETIKKNPGFDEQEYDVVLQDGNYVFKHKEDNSAKAPAGVSSTPPKP